MSNRIFCRSIGLFIRLNKYWTSIREDHLMAKVKSCQIAGDCHSFAQALLRARQVGTIVNSLASGSQILE
eukprot:scaffold330034_cov16-Prasinocladus_malaysianus.AAC.1